VTSESESTPPPNYETINHTSLPLPVVQIPQTPIINTRRDKIIGYTAVTVGCTFFVLGMIFNCPEGWELLCIAGGGLVASLGGCAIYYGSRRLKHI